MTESVSSSALPVDADGDGDDDVVSRNGCINPWFPWDLGMVYWTEEFMGVGTGTGRGVVVGGGVGVEYNKVRLTLVRGVIFRYSRDENKGRKRERATKGKREGRR